MLYFFFSRVKGTLSFTSYTSERSSNTVTNQLNQLGYKQEKKTTFYDLGKICYFCLIFGSREGLKSRCSPTMSSRNPLLSWRGRYSILQAPWQSAQTEPWRISGWCLCYESTGVAAEETAALLCDGLCFHEMSCWKWLKITIIIKHIFFTLTIFQENINSTLPYSHLWKCKRQWSVASVDKDKERVYLHLLHLYSSRQYSEFPKSKSDSFYTYFTFYVH